MAETALPEHQANCSKTTMENQGHAGSLSMNIPCTTLTSRRKPSPQQSWRPSRHSPPPPRQAGRPVSPRLPGQLAGESRDAETCSKWFSMRRVNVNGIKPYDILRQGFEKCVGLYCLSTRLARSLLCEALDASLECPLV